MFDFSASYVVSIEKALEKAFPKYWNRLDRAIAQNYLEGRARSAWSVRIAPTTCTGTTDLLVLVDQEFPLSQPRIVAPAVQQFEWPHVEADSRLCLRDSRTTSEAGDRVLDHLKWAVDVLNVSIYDADIEFRREFRSYWNEYAARHSSVQVQSVLAPMGPTREIVCFAAPSGRLTLGEDSLGLDAWLRHAGENPSRSQIYPSCLVWLNEPLVPREFPTTCVQVLEYIPDYLQRRVLVPGNRIVVAFGTETATGPALIATLLKHVSRKEFVKGFSHVAKVPRTRVKALFGASRPAYGVVERFDRSWIHGRNHDSGIKYLSKRRVGIVGCGSIGGSIARLLAQAGVGEFLFIDPDILLAANIARHALGHPYVGKWKSRGLAEMIQRDFPHIAETKWLGKRFAQLNDGELANLAACDVVISAGIDYEGDVQLDRWRLNLPRPPVHVCTWVEPYAIVGHAVAMFGKDSLVSLFDGQEMVKFRLTDWPEGHGLLTEAGCGNVFQPHGAIDLLPTIATASRLVLEIIRGEVDNSTRRVWMGNRASVEELNGIVRPEFTSSFRLRRGTV